MDPRPKIVNYSRFSVSPKTKHELNSQISTPKLDKSTEPKLSFKPMNVNVSLMDFENHNVIDVLRKIIHHKDHTLRSQTKSLASQYKENREG